MTGTEPFATAWVLLGLGILLGLSALSSTSFFSSP